MVKIYKVFFDISNIRKGFFCKSSEVIWDDFKYC